jgi:uroporphyrin-III C-methyltransferase
MTIGKVFLVGAGPGDPGLLTVRGLELLRKASVVVYDQLVNPALLEEAGADTIKIFVGKKAGRHCIAQDEINHVLIAYARAGHQVVRLKGGDPFVFGRGGEEAEALAKAHIPVEIVPGVSSAVAVPAYAGIPLTHRNYASSFAVVTGHEARKANSPVG